MEPTVLALIGAAIYFIPTINAYSRKHRSAAGIFLLNLFLGWTLLGWIIALVWSATGDVKTADPAVPSPATHVLCPECRELVLRDARKCKHCGCALILQ